MAKAKPKLPNKRIKVTLDDAIYINPDRVLIDLRTEFGDLLLSIDAANMARLIGEVANSQRVDSFARFARPKLVG